MTLSTHILDTALGRPAPGIAVTLTHQQGPTWQHILTGETDPDGRHRFPAEPALTPGLYRLHFDTAAYFAAQGLTPLHPYIEITFHLTAAAAHLHIPLLLTANGYTTYRGS